MSTQIGLEVASRQLLIIALVLAEVCAFAPSGAAAPEPILVDPAGDAYETTPADAMTTAQAACFMTIDLPPDSCQPLTPPPEAASAGAPAPPGRDIVALRMSETPTELIVELDVARLDTGMSDALPRDGTAAWWDVCWNLDSECVTVFANRMGGRIGQSGEFMRYGSECGDAGYCTWPVHVVFKAGTPGQVRFEVPRILLRDGEQGRTLDNAAVYLYGFEALGTYPSWTVTTPLRSPAGHYMPPGHMPDTATGGRAFTFQTPSASRWDSIERPAWTDQDGDVENPDRVPDIDVRQVALSENETAIQLSVEMGRVDDTAPPVVTYGAFSLSNGPALRFMVDDRTERRQSSLAMCGDSGCTYMVQAPGTLNVVAGAPGWINLTLPRKELGYPAAGTTVTNAWLLSSAYESESQRPVPPVTVNIDTITARDIFLGTPYYALRFDGPAPISEGTSEQPVTLVRDPAWDVSSRADIDPTAGMYDLVLVAAQATSPTTTRVTVGVRDLSRLAVPIGSKALVYTAGVETERGNYLVGFYRDADSGEFFCATDTLVFTDDKHDPAEAAWTVLDGVLSVANSNSAVAGSGSGGPSTLTVFVPHSCFGTDAPGEIKATSLVGSIHLIPQSPAAGVPLQEVWLADEARDDELSAFALGTPLPVATQMPWYAEPLGIEGFWDITGIALAVLLPLVGLVALRRKGSALKRYNEQIDRAVSAHATEAKAREVALVGIRRSLRDDMVHGRIREAHYLLVDARLADLLKQTRMHELTDAFGDLPHRLLQKLLEILADGTITREEARRFSTFLEDAALTLDAKQRIRRKIEHWVVGDASTGAPA